MPRYIDTDELLKQWTLGTSSGFHILVNLLENRKMMIMFLMFAMRIW